MHIKIDDLKGSEIVAFLNEHLSDMRSVSPPESIHALDLDGLRKSEITFWTIWDGDKLAGCAAIKELTAHHAEIKSMRTGAEFRRNGVASKLLQHIIEEAGRRHYQSLSLETGAMAFFAPAHKLYASFGFEKCAPFADYKEDPNSVFMTRKV